MRRGDCCLLKWNDVDLARRFITVKTAETGQTVTISIFPLLLDELASFPAPKLDLPAGKDLGVPRPGGDARAQAGDHLARGRLDANLQR